MQHNETVIDTAPEPRRVAALAGWQWMGNAWRLYSRDWLQWTLMVLALMVLVTVLSFIPLVSIATTLLMPVLVGGLMAAAERSRRGEAVEFVQLFDGFKQNTGELILVGLFYMIAVMIVSIVLVLLMLGVLGVAAVTMGGGVDELFEGMAAGGVTLGLVLFGLVAFGAILLVYSTYFFAPTLVMLRGMKAIDAMKLSMIAFWRNIVALTIYTILASIAVILACIPLMLGLIVLMPLLMLVNYTCYVDIFGDER